MNRCPKCGGRVADNRCTECLYFIPEDYKENPKKVFMAMPNLKEASTVVNRQYTVRDFADPQSSVKKSRSDIAKLIGKKILHGILMIGGIALVGTILSMLGQYI